MLWQFGLAEEAQQAKSARCLEERAGAARAGGKTKPSLLWLGWTQHTHLAVGPWSPADLAALTKQLSGVSEDAAAAAGAQTTPRRKAVQLQIPPELSFTPLYDTDEQTHNCL